MTAHWNLEVPALETCFRGILGCRDYTSREQAQSEQSGETNTEEHLVGWDASCVFYSVELRFDHQISLLRHPDGILPLDFDRVEHAIRTVFRPLCPSIVSDAPKLLAWHLAKLFPPSVP